MFWVAFLGIRRAISYLESGNYKAEKATQKEVGDYNNSHKVDARIEWELEIAMHRTPIPWREEAFLEVYRASSLQGIGVKSLSTHLKRALFNTKDFAILGHNLLGLRICWSLVEITCSLEL